MQLSTVKVGLDAKMSDSEMFFSVLSVNTLSSSLQKNMCSWRLTFSNWIKHLQKSVTLKSYSWFCSN